MIVSLRVAIVASVSAVVAVGARSIDGSEGLRIIGLGSVVVALVNGSARVLRKRVSPDRAQSDLEPPAI